MWSARRSACVEQLCEDVSEQSNGVVRTEDIIPTGACDITIDCCTAYQCNHSFIRIKLA